MMEGLNRAPGMMAKYKELRGTKTLLKIQYFMLRKTNTEAEAKTLEKRHYSDTEKHTVINFSITVIELQAVN